MGSYDDFMKAGLLSPKSRSDAGWSALAQLSSQLLNRGAPRLSPTPPPMDLGAVMGAYNKSMQNDLQRGMALHQFKRSEDEYARKQAEGEAIKAAFAPRMEPTLQTSTTVDRDGADIDTQSMVNMMMPSPLVRELPANLQETITTAAKGGLGGQALLQLIKTLQPRNYKRTYKQYVVPDGQGGSRIEPLTATEVFNYKQQGIIPVEYEEPFNQSRTFQQLTVQDEAGGTYTGRFDSSTGNSEVLIDGKYVPLKEGMKVITKGAVSRSASTLKDFTGLRDEVIKLERDIGKLQNYMQNVKDAGQGYQRLGQQFSTMFKTFFDSEKLTQAELAQKVADGQLQGLLGSMRLETVGGGVMTEQDALRVISNLGGDVTALQNPEVVGKALERLFNAKLARYGPAVQDYNAALIFTPGLAKEYDRREPKNFDASVFRPKPTAPDTEYVLKDGKLVQVKK